MIGKIRRTGCGTRACFCCRVGAPGLGDDAGFRTQRRTVRRGNLPAQRRAVLLYAQFALRQQSPRNKLTLSPLRWGR
jgi:hypothetical protein